MIAALLGQLVKNIKQNSNENKAQQLDFDKDDSPVSLNDLKSQRFQNKEGEMQISPTENEDDEIVRKNVQSTAIENVTYDPKKEIMWIKFVGGKKNYAFPSVPKEKISGFLKQLSKGRFYNNKLKGYAVKGFRA